VKIDRFEDIEAWQLARELTGNMRSPRKQNRNKPLSLNLEP